MRLGTRGSALALAQARQVARALEAAEPGLQVELVEITTSGDETSRTAAASIGDKSRFVKEIEEALLAGEIDLAVHSAKDVPGVLPDGLAIVGVPAREDARDALCGARSLDALADGASVGTSSLRRRAQLLAARPDLRGERAARQRGHAPAQAGRGQLRRRGAGGGRAPAAGPRRRRALAGGGADARRRAGLPRARGAPRRARRAELAAPAHRRRRWRASPPSARWWSGSTPTCHTPVAAYASLAGDGALELAAFVGLPDGSTWIRDTLEGDAAEPAALGREVAERS